MQRFRWSARTGDDSNRGPALGFPVESRDSVAGRRDTTDASLQSARHDWRTREDPFENIWPKILEWLETEPNVTAKQLSERLTAMAPVLYSGAQLRTLQRRVKVRRADRARELVTRILSGADADVVKADAATRRQPSPTNDSSVTISRE